MERNGTGHGVFGFAKCDGGALKRASLGQQYNGVSSESRRGEKVRAGSDPGLKEGERERERERTQARLSSSELVTNWRIDRFEGNIITSTRADDDDLISAPSASNFMRLASPLSARAGPTRRCISGRGIVQRNVSSAL